MKTLTKLLLLGLFAGIFITSCSKNEDDNLLKLIKRYALSYLEKDDLLFISEKIVAVMQNRSYRISDIKPSKLAVFLSKFVYKNPSGIGLAMPETMQLAIEEAGVLRILLASFCAVITKPLKIKGVFYAACFSHLRKAPWRRQPDYQASV